jgi:hypothetical protein
VLIDPYQRPASMIVDNVAQREHPLALKSIASGDAIPFTVDQNTSAIDRFHCFPSADI